METKNYCPDDVNRHVIGESVRIESIKFFVEMVKQAIDKGDKAQAKYYLDLIVFYSE